MDKLFELIHWLWIEAQLSFPPLVQDTVIDFLHRAKDIARLLLKPYLTIYQWRGQNESGSLTVNYAGLGYAAPFIKHILFMEEPTTVEIGKVPIWRPIALSNSSSSDIVIVEASKHLIQRLSGRNAITLPFQLSLVLDVQGSWEDVKFRFHRSVRNHELRLIRKYGYDYSVSHDDQSFYMFYHTMYLPTLNARYDKLASPMPVQEAYQHFRHGLLFLIRRDGSYVSGVICSVDRDSVNPMLIGVTNADRQLMKEGALGAVYYAMIYWANQEGFKYLNFGSCWPYMEGVVHYKRKWGSAAGIAPRHDGKRIWIKIQHDTPAVIRFLNDNPSVVIDEKGELRVLIVADDVDEGSSGVEDSWRKLYAMPGLRGPLICSVGALLDS